MAYGDVARAVRRGGPRQVGRVLAEYGAAVPWWRVVRADGGLPPSHGRAAWAHYDAEGTPTRGVGAERRVDMRRAGWTPAVWFPSRSSG